MAMSSAIVRGARLLLGGIRLVNGAVGLFYPRLILGRLSPDDPEHPAGEYALRLFGVRTVLIALDLLSKRKDIQTNAVQVAPAIHASDTVAALLAARSGRLPARAARLIVVISAVNTALAILMQWENRGERR